MKKFSKITSLVLSLATVSTIAAVPAGAKYFSDVSIGHWARESINYASENGFIDSASSSTFDPDGTFTRADVAEMLYRFDGEPSVSVTNKFTDVSSGASYAKAVSWMSENGIMNGTSSTTFEPSIGIKRQDLAVTFYRYASYVDSSGGYIKHNVLSKSADITDFSDYSKVNAYARDAMSWAVGVKLITGEVGGMLEPRKIVVRETGAEFLKRYGLFVEGINTKRDTFGFTNSSEFFKNNYKVNQQHLDILWSYLDQLKESTLMVSGTTLTFKEYIENESKKSTWSGSCRGMTTTVALNKLGKLDSVGNFGNSEKVLKDFSSYNADLASAINYYQLSQSAPTLASATLRYNKSNLSASAWKAAVDSLPQLIDDNGIIIWGITFNSVGHSLILYDYQAHSNGYLFYVYDPNYLSKRILSATYTSDGSVTIKYLNQYDVTAFRCVTGLYSASHAYNSYDLDSYYNDFGLHASSAGISEDDEIISTPIFTPDATKAYLLLSSNGTLTIKNAEGKSLVYSNGTYTGDMHVYNEYILNEGTTLALEYIVEVDASENFQFNETN